MGQFTVTRVSLSGEKVVTRAARPTPANGIETGIKGKEEKTQQ